MNVDVVYGRKIDMELKFDDKVKVRGLKRAEDGLPMCFNGL